MMCPCRGSLRSSCSIQQLIAPVSGVFQAGVPDFVVLDDVVAATRVPRLIAWWGTCRMKLWPTTFPSLRPRKTPALYKFIVPIW